MEKQKIIFASNNKHKIEEVKEMLDNEYEILSLNDIGFLDDIVEDGQTFEENAKIKCRAIKEYLGDKAKDYYIMADDSGLCVDALDGAPGIYSARYTGVHGDVQGCRDKLIQELNGKSNRDANFTCSMALIDKDANEYVVNGQTFGKILEKETGNQGFCYDCLFYSNDLKKCFGLCSSEEKNSVSHRARAVEKIKQILNNLQK